MTMDPNAFLMGTGGRSAKFKAVGDKVSGVIFGMEMRQQTSIDGDPLVWDDGKPRMQMVVTLLTKDHEDEDDDGLRRVFIKGQMQKAVRDAVMKAGQRGLGEGGELAIQYTGDAEPTRRGVSGAKQYRARYEAPQVAVPDDEDDAPPF